MSYNGFIDLPWWGYVLVTLGLTHVTIAGITIFCTVIRRIAPWTCTRSRVISSASGCG